MKISSPTPDLHSFPTRRSSDLVAITTNSSSRVKPRIEFFMLERNNAIETLTRRRLGIRDSRRTADDRHGCGDLLPSGITQSGFRSEEHTSELQSRSDLVCRLLL